MDGNDKRTSLFHGRVYKRRKFFFANKRANLSSFLWDHIFFRIICQGWVTLYLNIPTILYIGLYQDTSKKF